MSTIDQDWEELINAHKAYIEAVDRIINAKYAKVDFIKKKLNTEDDRFAFYFLEFLKPRELIEFAEELIRRISCSYSTTSYCRGLMGKIPKQWIKKNIEKICDKYIDDNDSSTYASIIKLYISLNLKEQAVSLSERALGSNDPEIKLVGQDYHQKIIDWDGPISNILPTL